MSNVEEKVAAMLAAHQITTEEAGDLLKAARTTEGRSRGQWLLAPATRLRTPTALSVTVSLALVSSGLAKLLNVRFDGALDVHLSRSPVSWTAVALDLLAYLPLTVCVVFLASRLFGGKGRFVDFFVSVGLARIAMVLQALVAALFMPMPQNNDVLPEPTAMVLFAALLALPLLVWGMAMLFFHFREASGLRRGRLAAGFITGMVAAEVLSKLFLTIL